MFRKRIVEEPSHKTVIVLDHGPKFAQESRVEIPVQLRDEIKDSLELIGNIKKTLWSHSTEAALEFHRVLTDLFPSGTKQLRFVVSDFIGRALTKSWAETKELISYDEVIDAFCTCEAPNPSADASSCFVLSGLSLGLEAISEQSALQKEIIQLMKEQKSRPGRRRTLTRAIPDDPKTFEDELEYWRIHKSIDPLTLSKSKRLHEDGELSEGHMEMVNLKNRGTLVVFTSFNRPQDFDLILTDIVEKVRSQNQMVENLIDGNRLPIDELQVYVLNIAPNFNPASFGKGNPPLVVLEDMELVDQRIKAMLYNCQAGDELNSVVLKILLEIYDLVSTTVSGIPMKEESQPGQSMNYDVELLHRRESHILLDRAGLLKPNSFLIAHQDHGNFDTVKLRWLSPSAKLKSESFPILIDAWPATPAYVNSRPAVCLTSFIVNNNKNVMLRIENPEKTGLEPNLCGNLITHFLTHEEATGVMMIQTVAFGPIASLYGELKQQHPEGIKPNLNYSIMNQLMKMMTVVPDQVDSDSEINYEENFDQAKRITSYFPVSLKDTFIFNIPEKFEPVISLMPKLDLTPEELEKCKKWAYNFVSTKTGAEPFTHKTLDCSLLMKNSRDEQFRVASEELYKYFKNYAKNSPKHLEHLNLYAKLLNFRELSPNALENGSSTTGAESPRTRDGRSSSPFAKKPRKLPPGKGWGINEKVNLYEFFNTLYEQEHNAKWRDFVGREKTVQNPAPLYQHLNLNSTPGDPRTAGRGGGGAGGM